MIRPPLISGGYVAAPDKAWLFQDHVQIISGTLVTTEFFGFLSFLKLEVKFLFSAISVVGRPESYGADSPY